MVSLTFHSESAYTRVRSASTCSGNCPEIVSTSSRASALYLLTWRLHGETKYQKRRRKNVRIINIRKITIRAPSVGFVYGFQFNCSPAVLQASFTVLVQLPSAIITAIVKRSSDMTLIRRGGPNYANSLSLFLNIIVPPRRGGE